MRYLADIGGGGLLDIACYCGLSGRYFFEAEPRRFVALVDRDPKYRTARLATVIADFGEEGHLSFACGTQTAGRQSVEVFGPRASFELVIPFDVRQDDKTAMLVGAGAPFDRNLYRREVMPSADHNAQGEAFALAVLG